MAGNLTIDALALLDLAYTPAFGTARDALNIAATVALQKANGVTADVTFDDIKAKRAKFFVLDVSTEPQHAGFHDAHIPLEKVRAELETIRTKFKTSKSKQIAALSETGRRGHLALRILKNAGLPVVNISGGRKLG
jgi:rhodanese-related sulfurtransferase